MKRLFWFAVLLFGVCTILFQQGFRFNATASMPTGIYQLEPGDSGVDRGETASFCLDAEPFASMAIERGYLRSGSCPNGSEPLLKIVVGLPGDLLEAGPEGVRINGCLLPESRIAATDSQNRPMPVSLSLSPGVIPSGLVFVLSDRHPGGFDSRYFGLVPISSLRKVKPVRMFNVVGGV